MMSHRTLPFVLVLTGACHGGKDAATGNTGWYDSGDSYADGAFNPDDPDGDGAVNLSDCNDFDPYVYPGAPEDCTNGIDDDCDRLIDGDRTLPNFLGELCDGDDDNADGVVDEGWIADCILPECEDTTGTGTDTGTPTPVRGGGLNWGRLGWAEPEPAPSTRSLRRVGSWVRTD